MIPGSTYVLRKKYNWEKVFSRKEALRLGSNFQREYFSTATSVIGGSCLSLECNLVLTLQLENVDSFYKKHFYLEISEFT